MADHVLCPRCPRLNPPENRFCGSCGTSLESSTNLVALQENKLRVMGRTLPAKLGPAGKVFAVGLVALAAQVGLSKLRHRSKAEDRASTLPTQESYTAVSEHLLWQSLEEVLIQELQGGHPSRVFAWRAIRSFVTAEPIDRRS
jgi:hypothetical protein